MKNLSKALALALLLAPVAAQARPWCSGEDEHIWTYFVGQAPYTFPCDDVDTPTVTLAAAHAEAECQERWDTFASNFSDNGPRFQIYYTEIGNSGICRWKYRCKACIVGFLPLLERPAVLGPADAGHVATGLVKGVVMSVKISDDGDDEADQEYSSYLVDVLTETRIVQVVVDATTGKAQIVTDDEPVSCLP